MASATPANPLARADALQRLGFSEPAEVDDVLRAVSAFCGAQADLVLGGDAEGRVLLDARGRAWGALRLKGPVPAACREGFDCAARVLEGRAARALAQRERRGPARTSSFVPGLVHELRNAAFGFSAILDAFEERYGDREVAQRYGGALRRNLEQLTGFIEELGVYGDPQERPMEPLPLDLVFQEARAQCQPQAEQLGLGLALAWEGPPVQVRADAAGLVAAFAALLRWAMGQGGGASVVLRARAEGGVAAGYLEGPGLKAAGLDLARVFEPFYFKAAGLGRLALPVARRIMEAHGGTLTASPGPGGEVRLAFTLPCREGKP